MTKLKLASVLVSVCLLSACATDKKPASSMNQVMSGSDMGYKLSGQAYTAKFSNGGWDGKVNVPNVFCTIFPIPSQAQSVRNAYFNNRSIILIDVPYPDKLIATLAVSTVPENQSADTAMVKVLNNERNNEVSLTKMGFEYHVSEYSTDFGRTVGVVAKNPTTGNQNGPFPLTRSFAQPTEGKPLLSMSVHRLFVHNHDRFEVAMFQLAPSTTTSTTEAEMTERLTLLADDMVRSLQKCTAAMPKQVAK